MGSLTENAQARFRRMRRTRTPEWYQTGQVIALVLIPVVLVVSYLSAGPTLVTPPSDVTTVTSPADPVAPVGTDATRPVVADGETTSVEKAGGGKTSVPSASLEVARLAGLASYTGRWDEVPMYGPAPTSMRVYPNASLGPATAYAVADSAITFVFKLDRDGNGSYDESFQISVVRSDDGWVFPSPGA